MIFSRKRNRTSDADSDGDDYWENVMRQRADNRAILEQIVPSNAPKLRPAKNRRGAKKGKTSSLH